MDARLIFYELKRDLNWKPYLTNFFYFWFQIYGADTPSYFGMIRKNLKPAQTSEVITNYGVSFSLSVNIDEFDFNPL